MIPLGGGVDRTGQDREGQGLKLCKIMYNFDDACRYTTY